MRASDHILANSDELALFFEFQRRELQGFGNTERFRELGQKYREAPYSAFTTVKPLWDCRTLAANINAAFYAEDDIKLSICSVRFFQQNFHKPDSVSLQNILDYVDDDKLLRVINYWILQIPLTPPFLVIHDNRKLGKIDGFHRIAATILVGGTVLPFWSDSSPPIKKFANTL